MQYEIFDDFKDGMVSTAIPLSWFRSVTNFIKNIGGGGVIKMRNENGAPTATIDTAVSQKANLKTEMTPFSDEKGEKVDNTFFDGDTGKDNTSWGVNEQNENDLNGCIVTLPTRMEHPMKDGSQTERDKSKIRMWFRSFGKSSAGLTAQISSEIGYKDFGTMSHGEKTSPDPTKGVSAHPDYYDYPDKQADPDNPKIVFPDWQRYYNMPGADHVPPARLTGDDNVTPVGWERGKTAYKNGHNVGDETDLDPKTSKPYEPVGLSMTVITHMRQITVNGTAKYQAMFSRMDFDENGLLVRVVPCSNWYTMM